MCGSFFVGGQGRGKCRCCARTRVPAGVCGWSWQLQTCCLGHAASCCGVLCCDPAAIGYSRRKCILARRTTPCTMHVAPGALCFVVFAAPLRAVAGLLCCAHEQGGMRSCCVQSVCSTCADKACNHTTSPCLLHLSGIISPTHCRQAKGSVHIAHLRFQALRTCRCVCCGQAGRHAANMFERDCSSEGITRGCSKCMDNAGDHKHQQQRRLQRQPCYLFPFCNSSCYEMLSVLHLACFLS